MTSWEVVMDKKLLESPGNFQENPGKHLKMTSKYG